MSQATGKMKLLSIDGGGVFGCAVLESLKNKAPNTDFDAFAGTSIGSVIAAWLAMGNSAKDLDDIFDDAMRSIFSKPWYSFARSLGMKAKWPTKNLDKFLVQYFNVRLGDIKKPLYITTVDRLLRRPKVYSTMDDKDADVMLYTALKHSVSAPTYFGTARYLDGGLFANDPSTVLACGVHDHFKLPYHSMRLLSMGTGYVPANPDVLSTSEDKSTDSWGLLSWAIPIVDTMLDINVTGFEFITSQLGLDEYIKFSGPILDEKWGMDDYSVIPTVRQRTKAIQSFFNECYEDLIA